MKIIGGITRSVLDSILSAYATIASLASYVTTTALAAYNYATQAWTQSYVATTIAGTFAAFNYKDNVQYSVNYVQSEVPDGTGTSGELCLVTGETPSIYEYTTSWAFSSELDDSDRVVFFTSGVDTTEPGYSATMKIYTYTEGEELDEYSLVTNDIFYLDSGNTQYRYDGTTCVEYPSIAPSLQLSSDELTAIQNATLAATDTVAKVSDIPAQLISLTTDTIDISQAKILSGWPWVYRKLSDIYTDFHYTNSNAAINDSFEVPFNILESGVYDFFYLHVLNNDCGIGRIYIDDILVYEDDHYSSVWISAKMEHFFSYVERGKHTIKFVVYAKNGASSGYYFSLGNINFRRIETNWNFYWTHGYSKVSTWPKNVQMVSSIKNGNSLLYTEGANYRPTKEIWYQNPAAINDEFWSPSLVLPAGTYTFKTWFFKNSNLGILSIYWNDTPVGSYDCYKGDGETYNNEYSVDFVLESTESGNLKFKVESKNYNSSDFYILVNLFMLFKKA